MHTPLPVLAEDQTLEADEKGVLLTATVSNSWQLRFWILSQGDGIVVLEPEELRAGIRTQLQSAVAGYQT